MQVFIHVSYIVIHLTLDQSIIVVTEGSVWVFLTNQFQSQ